MKQQKVIIFSAPSGSGKSTIVQHLISLHPEMEFSVSATSREPRGSERDGVEYHFLSNTRFEELIAQDAFIEWEQVYRSHYYGTLKSEVQKIWDKGHVAIFDVDVKGGVNLKKYFGGKALSIFIKAPSIQELRRRLVGRGTDSAEAIEERVAKAAEELTYEDKFDAVVVNDELEKAFSDAENLVDGFLK
ncbi:MAG: guanylate kinase [Bacteroidales bacterium]|nr:guanylate kinase [Bacteroidales bacterium]